MKKNIFCNGLIVCMLFSIMILPVDAQSSSSTVTLRLATHTPQTHFIVKNGFEPWAQELGKTYQWQGKGCDPPFRRFRPN